jgi:hypothetical protein
VHALYDFPSQPVLDSGKCLAEQQPRGAIRTQNAPILLHEQNGNIQPFQKNTERLFAFAEQAIAARHADTVRDRFRGKYIGWSFTKISVAPGAHFFHDVGTPCFVA